MLPMALVIMLSLGFVAVLVISSKFWRSARLDRVSHFSVVAILVFLFIVHVVTLLAFSYIYKEEISNNGCGDTDDIKGDYDFLTNVTTIHKKVLDFWHSSEGHGRDLRYWHTADRRRDGDHDEDIKEQIRRFLFASLIYCVCVCMTTKETFCS